MYKPFIQLFRTPRCFYVFDVNCNRIIPIERDTYTYLSACLSNDSDVNLTSTQEAHTLQKQGYLSDSTVIEDILHPYTNHVATFLGRKISKITLQVTQNCNLRCKYCIYSENINQSQRSHTNSIMSWEVAKQAIDFLKAHTVDSNSVNIGFYGGEPLLNLPLIEKSIEYSKMIFQGKELSFAITTNGTLLTDEVIDYFAHENMQLSISLDGPKDIHNANRVFSDGHGSFDAIMDNVSRIRERAPEYAKKIQFSMVIDPSNDFDCINELKFDARDLEQFNFLAAIVERDYDDEVVHYEEEYVWKSQYQQFLSIISFFRRFPTSDVSVITKGALANILGDSKIEMASGPLNSVDVPSGPCVPGKLRLFVDVSGRFFPCERVSENSKSMCIGSLDSGFDVSQISKLLNVGALTKESCRHCWSIRHCYLCAKKADDGSAELSPNKKLTHCSQVRMDSYEKLRRLILFDEVNTFYQNQTRM